MTRKHLIPQPFIDELLNRTDLVELVDSYLPLKKQGTSFTACCPFHSEKTPSFNVIPKKQFYHCFGCGVSGNAISFIMNYLNQGFLDAIETLATRLGLEVPKTQSSQPIKMAPNLNDLLSKVAVFYQKVLKASAEQAIQYLRKRGFTGEIAKKFQLGYAPAGWHVLEQEFRSFTKELILTGMLVSNEDGNKYDRYRHRLMFPIHDRHGRIIGFGGRALDDSQKPKYLNSPETPLFQKNKELYGLYQVLQQQTQPDGIIVVEGYLDVIALAQYGINNAVAALGTATSAYHIQLLSKHTKHIIFCFDGDKAGLQAAWRALENSLPYLNNGLDPRFVFLPENQDPDSLVRSEGPEAFKERLSTATPLHRYLISTLTKDIEIQSPAGRVQLLTTAKPYLQNIPEGPYKQLLLDELSRISRIESHRIQILLRDETTPAQQKQSGTINLSPIRLALALLLQNPEIYSQCYTQINAESLTGKDQEILRNMLEYIARTPNITPASLIEYWRDTTLFDALNKLATWNHCIPHDNQVKKLVDIVHFLQKQNDENAINQYISKSSTQGLTTEEQIHLKNLLLKKHKILPEELLK
jgi:DNA primase